MRIIDMIDGKAFIETLDGLSKEQKSYLLRVHFATTFMSKDADLERSLLIGVIGKLRDEWKRKASP